MIFSWIGTATCCCFILSFAQCVGAGWGEEGFSFFTHPNPFRVLSVHTSSPSPSPSSSEESDDSENSAEQPWMKQIQTDIDTWLTEDDKKENDKKDDKNDGSWTTVGAPKTKKTVTKKSASTKKKHKKTHDNKIIDKCIAIFERESNLPLLYAQLPPKDTKTMYDFLTLFYAGKEGVLDYVDEKTGMHRHFANGVECILLLRPWHAGDEKGNPLLEKLRRYIWTRIQTDLEQYPLDASMNPLTQLIRLVLAQRYALTEDRNAAYDALQESLDQSKKRQGKHVDYSCFKTVIQNYLYSHPMDEFLRKADKPQNIEGEVKEALLNAMQGLGELAIKNPLSAYYFLIYFFHKDLNPFFQNYIQERGMVLETVNTTAVKSLKNLSRLGFAGVYRYPFVSEHLQKSVDDLTHPYAFIQKLHLSQDVLHHMRHLIGKHVHLRTQEKLKRLEKWKGDVRQAMKYPDHILRVFT